MQTPYVPHYFGEAVTQKLQGRIGWLTAGCIFNCMAKI